MKLKLGIIGGTGFYNIDGLKLKDRISVDTPFGKPSDSFTIGGIANQEVIFLPRHGEGHVIMPSNINYCANIYAMKKLGVTHLISVSAVGSFKEEIKPGSIVLVDQFFDRTKKHVRDTFFDDGVVAHIAFADPICPVLHNELVEIAQSLNIDFTSNGIYVNIEGPTFSTRAESRIYKSMGFDVVGMTNIHEARLAREAEIHFATIAQVTDYDSWKEEIVDVPTIIKNIDKSASETHKILKELVSSFPLRSNECDCEQALKEAIVTDFSKISESCRKKYDLLLNKYIK